MVNIRPVELRDVDAIYRFRLDEEVMFWASGGYGNAIPAREQLVEQFRNQSPLDTQRYFVIELQEEEHGIPTVIGQISFRDMDRVARRATIGMLIGEREYWGKGYGAAALEKFVTILFARYNLNRIDMDTFADNKRAIRCYEKAGFAIEGMRRKAMWTMNGFRDQVVMGLLQEEWQKTQGNTSYYL
ncbi:GNAT family N-acetyltransferase [Cohnella lupini]|uniref:RimJ/RimL family protein N-acetyltransferase n=1 Tax=Cohnella lupini TaxID=1294267 RepID=A0A3D9IC35_9BACL|nr:GNAT family protein [Cohnella lupini]RED59332.1 RimJ/RimL family protein N-acetyltransferase [Cohnella lupini]